MPPAAISTTIMGMASAPCTVEPMWSCIISRSKPGELPVAVCSRSRVARTARETALLRWLRDLSTMILSVEVLTPVLITIATVADSIEF